jgi:radical SAM superfamily enzyme YgiQ (UPF0313 family)
MGGIHVSLVPSEARRHVDAVFVGECEGQLEDVFRDLEGGRLEPTYTGKARDLDAAPRPDRSIFAKYDYRYSSMQTSRGCPMDCSFCSVTAFNGGRFRMRPVSDVVEEVRTLPPGDILFVDDNLGGFSRQARARCAELCRQIAEAKLGRQWGTQVAIGFGDDDELPRLARAAGCAAVFVGLESVDTPSLNAISKDAHSRRRGTEYYRENIARLHEHGIAVVGSFMLGIDTQDMATIAGEILEFAESTELDGLNPAIFTPFPGTRDYARLEAAGRILFNDYPGDWARYTLAFPVMEVAGVSGAGLMRRYAQLLQFFRPDRIVEKYWRSRDRVSPEAAWHAFAWNRTWTEYCLRAGWFRDWPSDTPDIQRPAPAGQGDRG